MTVQPQLKRVEVGVGVFIVRNTKVLMGQRMNSHGAGTWALPGGHLEYAETIGACAKREVFEETGLKVERVRSLGFTENFFENEQQHYVTLFVMAEAYCGELVLKEPKKCAGWFWFDWDDLPEPLFDPILSLLEQGFSLKSHSPLNG